MTSTFDICYILGASIAQDWQASIDAKYSSALVSPVSKFSTNKLIAVNFSAIDPQILEFPSFYALRESLMFLKTIPQLRRGWF